MSVTQWVVGGLVAAAGAAIGLQAKKRAGEIDLAEASAAVKRHADEQPLRVRLDQEEFERLQAQMRLDPSRPAALSFYVEDRPVADLKVASCAYFGSTCCA